MCAHYNCMFRLMIIRLAAEVLGLLQCLKPATPGHHSVFIVSGVEI